MAFQDQEQKYQHVSGEFDQGGEWKEKYLKIAEYHEKFMNETNLIRQEYDKIRVVNEDHVKEIEQKAVLINNLQRRYFFCLLTKNIQVDAL